ncbi:rRNA maturation factor [Salimicrobium jeotgali]|uniref:Endoribonuclease YbeY n=1 Tax=Salimicrobium jeotgali TaxID=1230341 RepID=K2GB08_9BACI|nr:rRNA maturation factor [Salimicrobium jeotgali]MBM7695865.1 putative rRNA maturation factor [Salimicrobium jeotgali]
MLKIDFHDETNSIDEAFVDLIERVLSFAAEKEGVAGDNELSITFVNNSQIQELNRNYRQIDQPTDVLSFPMLEEGEDELEAIDEDMPRMLGDIVISVDKANEQADDYDHSLEREFSFLALHSLLHLLGYDHEKEEDEKKMFKRQEDILNEFGLERK